MEIRGKNLLVECACPFFAQHGPCKHAWATLLAAEEKGMLGDSPEGAAAAEGPHGEGPDAIRVRPLRPRGKRLPRGARRRGGDRSDDPGPLDPQGNWPPQREILYVLDAASTQPGQMSLQILIAWRDRRGDGRFTSPRVRGDLRLVPDKMPDEEDRRILPLLEGNGQDGAADRPPDTVPSRYALTPPLQETLVPAMCRTGRCMLRAPGGGRWSPLRWDEGPAWDAWMEVRREEGQDGYLLTGTLRRGAERIPLSEPVHLTAGGFLLTKGRAGRFLDHGAFPWIGLLRAHGPVRIGALELGAHLAQILEHPRTPRLDLPPDLRHEEVRQPPRPRLVIRHGEGRIGGAERLRAEISFAYGPRIVEPHSGAGAVYLPEERRLYLRDLAAEGEARSLLPTLGFRLEEEQGAAGAWAEIVPSKLVVAVRELMSRGWYVETEGVTYRKAGTVTMRVSSGVDWFDLDGAVDFDGRPVALPELLAAMRKGEATVRLEDGSFGLLPEEWLRRCGLLAGTGTPHEGSLRFGRAQAGVLDALLGDAPGASWDETFGKARDEIRAFDRVRPAMEPAGFRGTLRPYQREGLGWMLFLERLGFGGCLADDMGLGKTVQVLALLEARRARRGKRPSVRRPSLVVMPKSLLFNWKDEAAKFTPKLSVLEHFGPDRIPPGTHFAGHDLVFTTYGTLRRDIEALRKIRFGYCILDEAQIVKNAGTEAAKAVRLLACDHRLAMSGTPVENHIGELWTHFGFLNPGMLGSRSELASASGGPATDSLAAREALARAVRPFLLRRTKGQVAKDLPPRTEQTLFCEMDDAERERYAELRMHYRDVLLKRLDRDGVKKSSAHVLEALLRLRQAACHPGLLDPAKGALPSAKLETFLDRISEIIEEGHKALVYSQFTSFLAIVKTHLDERKIVHEYLDGKTRDRAAHVERFQTDPDCPLFLLSLKAGGVGLNLTAAEYVFLLDPWWNPAVEAQAMDRAHRIGQSKAVFAYRLITRD
ncbi:MAG: DEAD/DEAH box helicase, partial [Planctomycetes bacterium]|nr:DEAD/DEAH box helicase [Planctomycetota bacterium]